MSKRIAAWIIARACIKKHNREKQIGDYMRGNAERNEAMPQ